jgi:hypothetical protein
MGRYLIVPPYVWPYNQRELSAPVLEWKILQRFETATACEGSLQELKEEPESLHGEYSVAAKFKSDALKKMGEMGIGLFALKDTRCVFSDDPRLNEK